MDKNIKRIRLFGGNNLKIKLPGGWTSLGHMLTGTVEDKTESQEITFADGNSIDIDGKRKVKISVTLAQSSKEELELVDTLRNGTYPVYYYNGVVDSKPQAIYFKETNIIPTMTLKSPDNPMNIVLEFSILPQNSVVTLDTTVANSIPSGSEIASYVPGTYTGKNNFYLIIEGNGTSSGS